MGKRFFSVSEARKVLPVVRELTRRMVAAASQLEEHRAASKALAANRDNDSGSSTGTGYVRLLLVFRSSLEELRRLGCEVKDPNIGLIDFPHLRNGREVYLCWRLGETDIDYWHEADAGYRGRRPLREPS